MSLSSSALFQIRIPGTFLTFATSKFSALRLATHRSTFLTDYWRSASLLFLFLFALQPGYNTAHAGTVTALEPTNFTRGNGAPVVETHNFSVEQLNGDFVLTIYNGGMQDDEGNGDYVSSSTISVNDVLVIGPHNFNQNTSLISVPVSLTSANELEVELRGKQGGVVTIEIAGNVNNSPVADAGINQSVTVGDLINMDGSASFDDDGDQLGYQWSVVAKPSNSQVILSQASTEYPSFTADIAGNYVLGLVVNDGLLESAQSQVYVSALNPNSAPILDSIGDHTVNLGTTFNFTLSATDPEGDTLRYSIQNSPLPEGMTLDSVTGDFGFIPGAQQSGSYSLGFQVSDGAAIDSEIIILTVPPADNAIPTSFSGQLLDATAFAQGITQPIEGGTVSFLNSPVSAVSDNNGYFNLANLADGSQVLDIDNTTAQNAPDGSGYASFREKIVLIANVENIIERAIYLPRIAAGSLTAVDPNTTTIVENTDLDISLSVPPHTALNEDGTEFTGQLSISLVPKGLEPAPLPANLQFGQLITIQPVGVNFDTPVPITFPNVDNLVPGSQTNLWSIDPNIGEFTIVGTGEVTPDGLYIETVSGGIQATDWHSPSSPGTPGLPDTDNPNCGCGDESDSGSSVNTRSGWLTTDFELPSYQSLSRNRSLNFVYRSEHAYPRPIIPFDYTIPVRSAVPPTVSYGVSFGGINQGNQTFIGTAGLSENIDENLHAAVQIDGSMLDTGIHPYDITLQSNFPFSSVGTNISGNMSVVNKRGSEFGAGWSLSGLNRLIKTGENSILILNGSGQQSVFTLNTAGLIVYDNDFESSVGAEWSHQTTSGNAVFTNFLGRFGVSTGPVSLSLVDLPVHSGVELLFDFYAIDSWDGNGGDGPDKFKVGFDGNDTALLDEFFNTNQYSRVSGNFGFTTQWEDSIYENLNSGFYFEHSDADLTLSITGQPNQGLTDESWGIDDIRVAVGEVTHLESFESGSLSLFEPDSVNGGLTLVVQEGDYFSSGSDTTIIELPGDYSLNIRSNAASNTGSIGVVTSPLFVAGDRLMFRERSESTNVNIAVRILDENDNILLSKSIPPTLNTFRLHTISTSQFSGDQIRVQFRQNTLQQGLGWYTLIDNINLFFGEPAEGETQYAASSGDFSTLFRHVDGSFTRTMKNQTQIHFDASGLQTEIVDRNGNSTVYSYNGSEQLIAITDPVGKITIFDYVNDQLTSVTDPAGRTSSFEYDNDNNLIKVTYPDGSFRRYVYDPHHLMTLEADRLNRTTVREFDFAGRLQNSTRADGSTREMSTMKTHGLVDPNSGVGTSSNPAPYTRQDNNISTFTNGNGESNISETDGFGRLIRRTDANGLTTLTERDLNGNATKTTRPDLSEILRVFDDNGNQFTKTEGYNGATSESSFDPQFSLVSSTTDALSNITTYSRDPGNGDLNSITNALGHQIQMEYNSDGQINERTDANGLVTTYGYNTDGLVETVIETPPVGGGLTRTTVMTYDAAGQVESVLTPDNITQSMDYDLLGRLTSITDNLNQRVEFEYDAEGNRILSKTLEGDGTITYTLVQSFDALNRLITTIQPHISGLDSINQFEYDGAGNLDSTTDPKGQESNSQYDPGNRLISQIDALVGSSQFEYDSNGNLTQVVAANGALTDYEVDSLGRIVTELSPDRGTQSYGYDLNNNLKTLTDARGITSTFDYDALNRLVAISFPNSQEDVALDYDSCTFGIGRLCGVTDESGTTTLQYDAFGNTTEINYNIDGVDYSQHYEYDIGHRISNMTLPSGRQVDYQRDGLQRTSQINSIINGQSQIILSQVGYNASDQVTGSTYGNGLVESRLYDLQGRLLTLQLAGADQFFLTYDANGNVLSRNISTDIQSYGYDALNRLKSEINNGVTTQYQYDPNGNRLNETESGQSIDYSYSLQSNILDSIDDQALSYDSAGNLIIDSLGRYLTYNNSGRLVEIQSNGQTLAVYRYSSNGRRTHKITSLQTTIYHYDQFGNLVSETTDTGILIRDYVWHEGRPVAQIDFNSVNQIDSINYIHADDLDTPRLATDENQIIIWRWEGKAFGESQPQSSSTSINLRFPGQYYDAESGFHYNHFRTFNPATGRYIESDPIGLEGGENTYLYGYGNPLKWTDPEGLIPPPTGWPGGLFRLVNCPAKEKADCKAQCANRGGVKTCKVTKGRRNVIREGTPTSELYIVPGSMNCVCNNDDSDDGQICGENCQQILKSTVTALGIVVLILIDSCTPIGAK